MTRLALCAVALATLMTVPAQARVHCSPNRVAEIRAEVAASTAVFEGVLLGPGEARGALAAGERGVVDRTLRFRVTRSLRGALAVGDEVAVVWEGWSEPEAGPITGGCRVPGSEPRSGRRRMMVIATGEPGALRVANRTASTWVHPNAREVVRRIERAARRTRGSAEPR